MAENWVDVGAADELSGTPLARISVNNRDVALSFKDGKFGAVANACNHVGGPLGEGRLDGDYIVCPWHGWKFHRVRGVGEPGFEEDCVPAATSSARPDRCVSPASRPPRWMPPIRASRAPTTCSTMP